MKRRTTHETHLRRRWLKPARAEQTVKAPGHLIMTAAGALYACSYCGETGADRVCDPCKKIWS